MSYTAVVFDLGGVVLGSPLHAIRRYETELGLPHNSINRVVADTAPHGAWSRLERGELSMEAFFADFESDCLSAGLEICARTMFEQMGEESKPRPAMIHAISEIRERGLRVGALTNNWASADGAGEGAAPDDGTRALRGHFDVFIESCVVGMRKPDPRIYQLACKQLEAEPHATVFLDDIGSNLKSARELGLHTIKVDTPEAALAELEAALGFPLGERPTGPGNS